MTDLHDEQPHETADEPIMGERRSFLRSLGKWSQAVIGGVLAGGALTMTSPAVAASWVNRHGSGGWYNRGGSWANRSGGGSWYNRGGGWYNRGGGWVNRSGGGGWVNRSGGGGWANRGGGWHNRGGSWYNR